MAYRVVKASMRSVDRTAVKDEFRRLLQRHARALGLTNRAIDILVARAATETLSGRRQAICSSSDPGDFVRFVIQGVVAIVCQIPRQRPLIVQLVGPGHFFCVPPGRDQRHYAASVVPYEAPTLALLAKGHIREAMEIMPAGGLAQLTSGSWRRSTRLLFEKVALLRMPLADRVPHELRRLVRGFGEPVDGGFLITLRLRCEDLGDLVAGARAPVNRVLRDLERRGLIKRRAGQIIVSDRLMTEEVGHDATHSGLGAVPARA